MNFSECLKFTLKYEGGYVNHPKDPGGATNLGVTLRTYEKWTGKKQTPTTIAMLTESDVKPIYKSFYWDKVSGDSLPEGIDLLTFDFAVNSGPGTAAKRLQELFPGMVVDGGIGPVTLASIRAEYKDNPIQLIDDYCNARLRFLKGLPTFVTFGKGWTSRVEAARKAAKGMAKYV